VTLPEPWYPINDVPAARTLADELACELSDGQLLFGVAVEAVARRADRDDVLFRLLDGSGRLAVVHLTWRGQAEPPPWPVAALYTDETDWLARETGDG